LILLVPGVGIEPTRR